jgi:hypothetical protein
MATTTKKKPAVEKPTAKKVLIIDDASPSITGLVILRSKSFEEKDEKGKKVTVNEHRTGISLKAQDDQEIDIEIAVPTEFADTLKVDGIYQADFYKGKKEGGLTFEVSCLNEIDLGRKYEEKMIVKGDVKKGGAEGHIYMKVLPKQEDVFWEKETYTLVLTAEATEE